MFVYSCTYTRKLISIAGEILENILKLMTEFGDLYRTGNNTTGQFK